MQDPPRPRTNIAVCGDFKQLQLVEPLNKRLDLGKVFYSGPLSRNASFLGLSDDQAENLFVKEYLLQFHARYLNHALASRIYPLYDRLWTRGVLRRWQPCDVLLMVIQGKSPEILQLAKRQGSRILGHPVTCEASFINGQIKLETERLGLRYSDFVEADATLGAEAALCDRLYCLSELVKDSYVAAGFPAERIDVIRLPTDLTSFSPSEAPPPRPFRVGCIGSISPVKGHIHLLEAWKALKLPDAELILAGTCRQGMKRPLAPYAELFQYRGPLDRARLVELYRSLSLLVVPSVQEGFSLVTAEALACGVPVIVTTHVGAKDIILPGENGFVVPVRDSEALAAAILDVYRSEELRAHLRQGALASRAAFPTLEETADRLATIIRAMAEAPPEQ